MVEVVEVVADLREHIATVFAPLVARIPYNIQLYEEKLLELQSHTSLLQFLGMLRIVDFAQRFVSRHQV